MAASANPIIVGIAGGIASGKSFVTDELKRLGATVISADEAAHKVLKLEEVKRQARSRWGEAIFNRDGEIERAALARIVFAPPPDGPRERSFLEQLTHPQIGEMIRQQVAELAEPGTARVVVLDVPLLFESGWNKICNVVVFVDAPLSVRQSRSQERGWNPEEIVRREEAQQPAETKRQRADVVIDNSASRESTLAQVGRFWQSLFELPQPN